MAVHRRIIEETDSVDVATEPYSEPLSSKIGRIIVMIINIIIILLVIRLVLSLLGANPQNAFADFTYSITEPFVAPFYGLFSNQYDYGISRLEVEAIVAILVYGLLSWLISSYVVRSRPPAAAP